MFPLLTKLDPQGYYARLGVDPGATPDAIAAAYRRQARLLHPDIPGTGDTDAFVAAKQAYDILADPVTRAAYDRKARLAASETGPGEWPFAAARPVPKEPPSRQPRWSDLPALVWVGISNLYSAAIYWLKGPGSIGWMSWPALLTGSLVPYAVLVAVGLLNRREPE